MSEEKKAAAVNCPLLVNSSFITFPGMKAQMLVLPEESAAAEKAHLSGSKIFVTSLDSKTGDINEIGTLGTVLSFEEQGGGHAVITYAAETRARMSGVERSESLFLVTSAEPLEVSTEVDAETVTLAKTAVREFIRLFDQNSPELLQLEKNLLILADNRPAMAADALASRLNLNTDWEQELLETLDTKTRLQQICIYLSIASEEQEAQAKASAGNKGTALALRNKMDANKKTRGGDDDENEIEALERKIQEAGMTEEALKKCEKELKRLKGMDPTGVEANKIVNYLDWMTSIPWSKESELTGDLKTAQEILDADHYGLDDVKKRILEHLAVQQRTGQSNGTILCLLGPPGVGKTSIGKSIAKATGREFLRISLGGVDDESAVRGHRRTYVGSEPGTVINNMKNAGTINPVIQLDEIDKMGQKGDGAGPTAAMLELLDPEQNSAFKDHYLDVNYDMSGAMFVCTANDLSTVPRPLLDRMEIIEIDGYMDGEKMEIAKRYLLPKALEKNGVKEGEFSIDDEALAALISEYTMESGVRNLEREINALTRKALMEIDVSGAKSVALTTENLEKFAGKPKVTHSRVSETDEVGRVNGLYVSGAGGGILPLVAVKFPDNKGGAVATGSLQQVMQESVSDAYDYVRSNASALGIPAEAFQNTTLHIKAGGGGIPKDGPSAGLALTTLIVSTLTGIPIRADVAMTGEVGLHGSSMVIGGVKQKLMGAYQAGAKTVLIPQENVKDLDEVPDNIKQALEIIPVSNVMEVLQHALVEMPTPLAAVEQPADEKDTETEKLVMETISKVFAQAAQQAAKTPANDTAPRRGLFRRRAPSVANA